jgi:hypothetical protein
MTETVERTVFGVFPLLAPVYNDTITYARYLTPLASGAADGVPRWSWIRSGAAVHLVHEHRGPTDCDAVVPVIASQPAMLRPQVGRIGWIGLVGFLLLLVAWVSHGVRRIFFGDVEDDAQPVHGDGGGAGEPSGDWQLGRLGDPADRAWALAEIAPIAATGLRVPENAVEPWCGPFRTRRAVADRVLEAAHEHYEKLWTDCSREERLLLVQLVEERIANPKQAEVVRALLRRGLLRRDPMLRPMNNSFALFVEHRVDRREVKAWESEIQGLRWSHVRTLLIAALAIVIVFLSVTQRDAVEVWLAYLGTAAAGTAGVLRLLGAVNRSAAQQAAE